MREVLYRSISEMAHFFEWKHRQWVFLTLLGLIGFGASFYLRQGRPPVMDDVSAALVELVTPPLVVFGAAFVLLLLWGVFVRTPYQMLREQRRMIDALQTEVATISSQVAARKRSKLIHEAMLRHRSIAIGLLNRRVQAKEDYPPWKSDWRRFESELIEEMERLGCSAAEIHGAQSKNVGALGKIRVGKDSEDAEVSKGILVIQIQQLQKVAADHDTSLPTA